jgi:hypothetical protein
VNLPAVAIVLLLTAVLVLGIRASARINIVIVCIKLAIVLFVFVAGISYIKTSNWDPFVPPTRSPAGRPRRWIRGVRRRRLRRGAHALDLGDAPPCRRAPRRIVHSRQRDPDALLAQARRRRVRS